MLPELKFDANGLIPAVIQDADSREVLMVAWMDPGGIGVAPSNAWAVNRNSAAWRQHTEKLQ